MTSEQDKANPPPDIHHEVLGQCRLFRGDCIESMASLPDHSVDSIVTDPPYGIRFMGKSWDGQDIEKTIQRKMRKNTVRTDGYKRHDGAAFAAGTYDTSLSGNQAFQLWTEAWAREAFRVLKPGGHLMSFASPRTYHRMTVGIENAGFEIRDQIMWLFGSGFPKSHNLQDWKGWGTALKPAHEPIVLARKPFRSTVAENMSTYGTGGINIDGCRIEIQDELRSGAGGLLSHQERQREYPKENGFQQPANVLHDGSDVVISAFPEASGQQAPVTGREPSSKTNNVYGVFNGRTATHPRGDSGSAARFFYCAKASKEDREEGLAGFEPQVQDDSRKEGKPGGNNPRNRGLKRRANHFRRSSLRI